MVVNRNVPPTISSDLLSFFNRLEIDLSNVASRTAWTVSYWTESTSGRALQMTLVVTPLKEIGRRSHASKSAKVANEVGLIEVSTR